MQGRPHYFTNRAIALIIPTTTAVPMCRTIADLHRVTYILQFYTGNYFLICPGRACHSFLINQIENYCVTRDNKSTINNYSVLVLANEALKMSCQKVVVIGVRNLVISAAELSVQ